MQALSALLAVAVVATALGALLGLLLASYYFLIKAIDYVDSLEKGASQR